VAARETIIVTKRGKPVAQVVAVEQGPARPLRGSVRVLGDIVSPVDDSWDATE
jgi:antitoxin (DNA-binding transcriptional repressor) of toxin-antitoxin stability system